MLQKDYAVKQKRNKFHSFKCLSQKKQRGKRQDGKKGAFREGFSSYTLVKLGVVEKEEIGRLFLFLFLMQESFRCEFQLCHLLASFAHLENDAVKIQLSGC